MDNAVVPSVVVSTSPLPRELHAQHAPADPPCVLGQQTPPSHRTQLYHVIIRVILIIILLAAPVTTILAPSSVMRYPSALKSSFAAPTGALPVCSPIYVSAEHGNDNPGCGCSESPCETLRYAVDQLSLNAPSVSDEPFSVIVLEGNYSSDNCNISTNQSLIITGSGSGFGSNATIMDCQGVFRLLDTNASLSLSAMTIIGGNSNSHGGAILVDLPDVEAAAAVNISDVVFADNTAGGLRSHGGALAVLAHGNRVNITISNCSFSENRAGKEFVGGGAVYVRVYDPIVAANVLVANSTFIRNNGSMLPLMIALFSLFHVWAFISCRQQPNATWRMGWRAVLRLLGCEPIRFKLCAH